MLFNVSFKNLESVLGAYNSMRKIFSLFAFSGFFFLSLIANAQDTKNMCAQTMREFQSGESNDALAVEICTLMNAEGLGDICDKDRWCLVGTLACFPCTACKGGFCCTCKHSDCGQIAGVVHSECAACCTARCGTQQSCLQKCKVNCGEGVKKPDNPVSAE